MEDAKLVQHGRVAKAEGTKAYTIEPCHGGVFIFTLLLAAVLTAGCSSVSVEKARANFYSGRFVQANANLKEIPPGDKDEVLCLSERGMIRQNLRLY